MPDTHRQPHRSAYLTAAEAGRLAGGLTPSAVRMATIRGQLEPALVTASGIRLYLADAVLAWRRAVRERQRRRDREAAA